MLKRVLYVSDSLINPLATTATEEMADLLTLARRNNSSFGITGALLWSDGHFAQAIEGEADPLAQIFERILRDRRHHNINVLQFDTVGERAFPDWSMAFVEKNTLNEACAPEPSAIPVDADKLLSYLSSLVR